MENFGLGLALVTRLVCFVVWMKWAIELGSGTVSVNWAVLLLGWIPVYLAGRVVGMVFILLTVGTVAGAQSVGGGSGRLKPAARTTLSKTEGRYQVRASGRIATFTRKANGEVVWSFDRAVPSEAREDYNYAAVVALAADQLRRGVPRWLPEYEGDGQAMLDRRSGATPTR